MEDSGSSLAFYDQSKAGLPDVAGVGGGGGEEEKKRCMLIVWK